MQDDPSLSAVYGKAAPILKGKLNNGLHALANTGNDMVQVQDPLSPFAKDKISMSPMQWMSTFDEKFKKTNPEYAAMNAYYDPFQTNRSVGYAAGNGLQKLYSGYAPHIGAIMDKGPVAGGLLSMLPGLLAGAAGTGLMNFATGRDTSDGMLRNALIGGLATGALGAYSGYLRKNKPQFAAPTPPPLPQSPLELQQGRNMERSTVMSMLNKQAFMQDGGAGKAKIIQAINSTPGLSFTERSQLIAGVSQLAPNDISQLASTLTGVIGASVGAVVARYLMNRGLIGTVLGAIFGGTIAKSVFGPSIPTNDLGQASLQGRTITGKYL